jgi:hypothetical protein
VRRVTHILLFPSFLFDRGPVALDEVGTEGYGRCGLSLTILGLGLNGTLVAFRPTAFPPLELPATALIGISAFELIAATGFFDLGSDVTDSRLLGGDATSLQRRLALVRV